jgi:hypothetical protein
MGRTVGCGMPTVIVGWAGTLGVDAGGEPFVGGGSAAGAELASGVAARGENFGAAGDSATAVRAPSARRRPTDRPKAPFTRSVFARRTA